MTSSSLCEYSRWPLGSQRRKIGSEAEATANSMSLRGTASRKARFLPLENRRQRPSVIRWLKGSCPA
eukprot:3207103-Pleurochrysis_carterae.AAC.1